MKTYERAVCVMSTAISLPKTVNLYNYCVIMQSMAVNPLNIWLDLGEPSWWLNKLKTNRIRYKVVYIMTQAIIR